MTGAFFGLLAALILGVNTILIAIAARWWGVWRTTASALTIAFVLLLVYAGVTGQSFPFDESSLVILLLVLGFAAGASYFASHQGLRLGPVSVVSPIGSTTGAMTVALAFVILGERPNVVQWVGIPLATIGVVLLSLEIKRGGRIQLIGWGPMFAFLGVVTGAVSNAVLRIPVRDIGVLPTIIGQRTFTVAFVVLAWPFVIRANRARARGLQSATPEVGPVAVEASSTVVERLSLRAWSLLLLVGFLDAAAFLSFAQGLSLAPAWLIGLLSQSGRMIAIVGGYILFNERLLASQWLGLLFTIAGLVLAVAG